MGGFGDPGLSDIFFFLIVDLAALALLPLTLVYIAVNAVINNKNPLGAMLMATFGILAGIPYGLILLVAKIVQLCVIMALGLANLLHPPQLHLHTSHGPGSSAHTESDPLLLSSKAPFDYTPLEGRSDIRVLVIYPGPFSTSLEGDIVTANLLWWPSYDALSYTWADDTGDTTRSKTIRIRKSDQIIKITANCEAAIRRLRRTHGPRRVWVDAVCINQADDDERNQQVSLMPRIYTSARNVIAYTGEATARSDRLFDWLNGLDESELIIPSVELFDRAMVSQATRLGLLAQQLRKLGPRLLPRKETSKKNYVVLSDGEIVDLVREYSTRRWFKRIWVIQEVSLPDLHKTSIICGTKSTTGKRAMHLLSMIKDQEAMACIFVLLRHRMNDPNRSYLLDIMIQTSDRECGDPRDKIFGVLGITRAMDRRQFPQFAANYEDSQEAIFARFSAFFIAHHGASFFLSLIKSPRRLKRLPSWAADWTAPWPNRKAVGREVFAARSASVTNESIGADFIYEGGQMMLRLLRPRILRGYFTRNGHMDDSDVTTVEPLSALEEDEVLVELYPGLAALLKKGDDYYSFRQVCPHALFEAGVRALVERWSRVVHGEGLEAQRAGQGNENADHLSPSENFTIR